MKMKKLFPPHLSQLVFVNEDNEIEKINSLDYDIFIWLIYQTDKNYDKTKDTYVEFEYSKIKESIKSNPNTKSIKSSLEKLDRLQIWSNYLLSYGDKEIIKMKPFHIEIVTSDNGKSYGFGVKTSKKFLNWFDNPTPNVEVDYTIIYNLNKMSKLLYLFLRDALGIYQNKNRNADNIDKLRHMMNISNENTSNTNFITQLKKSIKDVNENSNITVSCKTVKERNLKSGLSEIVSVKFSIEKDDEKLLKKRCSDTKSIVKTETIEETITDTVSVETTYENYLKERVEEEFENSYHSGVKNIGAYKNKIKNSLIENGLKEEYEITILLSTEKDKLKSKITDNQTYEIILRHKFDERENLYFNSEYLLTKFDNSKHTTSKFETLQMISDFGDNYFFDTNKCGDGDEFKVGRI